MLKKWLPFYSFTVSLFLLLFLNQAFGTQFNFSDKESSWSFYGDGVGFYDFTVGREAGSLKLSCDWGENETSFFEWKDLKPGHYTVTYFIKAHDLQTGPDKVSLWNFYDSGKGTETSIHNLTGTFNWKKVQFSLYVAKSSLTVWFRLKGPGQVWIDDFSLQPHNGPVIPVTVTDTMAEFPEDKEINSFKQNVIAAKTPAEVVLFDFNLPEKGHPFTVENLKEGKGAGKFKPHKFYDFSINKLPVKNWKNFDRMELDIFNPNKVLAEIIITLGDNKSQDYWSQLNHKQSLAPGWNRITFSLTQFVGERGSHRYFRSLDYSQITKFHLIVDPDRKMNFDVKNFYIDNIKLSSNPVPAVPENILAFDFTSQKSHEKNSFQKISSQTLFNEQRGYGFVKPLFWRIENSYYASDILKYSIGLLDGSFKVKIPNGKYRLSLVMDKLGYWDVPFWRERSVYINGKIHLKESRPKGQDYLKDLLLFEQIEPNETDNPYNLYLGKIFKPYEFTVEVTNSELELKFMGDASAIALNTLVIWNIKDEIKARTFLAEVEKRNKLEFSWITRPLKIGDINKKLNGASVSIIEPDLKLTPSTLKASVSDLLLFEGGKGERPYQVLQLNPGNKSEKFSWSVSDLINEKGDRISGSLIDINDLVFQYTSPDLNHETYTLTGKIIKKREIQSINIAAHTTRFLWLQLKISDSVPVGVFKGALHIQIGKQNKTIPMEIHSLSYKLPKVEFPVGFMGLDPLPYSYFPDKSYEDLRTKYRYMALKKLADSGFTTFSGLPEVKLKKTHDKMEIDFSALDDLLIQSKRLGFSSHVFSYGGQFPQKLLDSSLRPAEVNESDFILLAGKQLKEAFVKKDWPVIVHTFSDEASGYSDSVNTDIEAAKKLKKHFPFMALGGFGSFEDKKSEELFKFFDYGFYSRINRENMNFLSKQNLNWGLYNSSPGNFDDPRNVFGPGLYYARKGGLSHFLEWNSLGFNNYPYYELDGREADVALFYPSSNGSLYSSLRFEFASEGLQLLRKLFLLEQMLDTVKAAGKPAQFIEKWLVQLKQKVVFDSSEKMNTLKKLNFKKLNTEVTAHLKTLSEPMMTSHFTPKKR